MFPHTKSQNREVKVPVTYELDEESVQGPVSENAIRTALERTFHAPGYKAPMLPQVALDVMALSSKPDVEIGQLVRLLETDSLLSGRVLKLANSPLYAGADKIQSLRTAVTRLGLRELRDLVIEAAMGGRIFKAVGYNDEVERVRIHSMAVAHAARTVTRFTPFEAEYAFLCGLLHDVGMSAALVALGDVPRGQTLAPLQDVMPALAPLHEELGAKVLESWSMPAEVILVVKHHHTLKVAGMVHPVAAIVSLAAHFTAELGLASALDAPDFTQQKMAQAALGFDEARMTLVSKAVTEALKSIR